MDITRMNDGPWMSGVVIHGSTVYLSGQIPDDEVSIADQTQAVLAKIDRALAQANSHRDHILNATIILSDMANFMAMNEVWEKWLSGSARPARACFEGRLAKSSWKVEIVITAAVSD